MKPTREQLRQLRRDNEKQPLVLKQVPRGNWPAQHGENAFLLEVWRSREFLVQVFDEQKGIVRISVNRTSVDMKTGRWVEGISWEEMQRVKREIGRADCDAVEIYPRDRDIVNVANMRHLFLFTDDLFPLAWRRGEGPLSSTKESPHGKEKSRTA